MKIEIKNNIPYLIINEHKIKGFKSLKHPRALIFSNESDDNFIETNFYELIKKYSINDFQKKGLRIEIMAIRLGLEPKILEKLPYPFWTFAIEIKDSKFLISFEATQEIGWDEQWDKKWVNEFYFEQFSKLVNDDNITVVYNNDSFLNLNVLFKNDEKTIENAVEKSIKNLKSLIKTVEAKINGLGDFFEVIDIWKNTNKNKNEKFWHKTLKKYSWLLSLIINEPTIILEDEAYVGGKTINNKGGNIVDFIFKNNLSENLALIEIKTPQTKLLGKPYRNTYTLSSELTGAINQLLNYSDLFQKNYYSLANKSNLISGLTVPNSYLIIGNHKNLTIEEKQCFELYRRQLKNVNIITFDELFEKAFFILKMISDKSY